MMTTEELAGLKDFAQNNKDIGLKYASLNPDVVLRLVDAAQSALRAEPANQLDAPAPPEVAVIVDTPKLYPYDAIFRAIGDATARQGSAIAVSVEQFVETLASKGYVVSPAVPVAAGLPASDEQPMIGKLLDAFSEIEHLWGLNEPGALVRHRDVFNMIVKIGKEQAAAAPVLPPALPAEKVQRLPRRDLDAEFFRRLNECKMTDTLSGNLKFAEYVDGLLAATGGAPAPVLTVEVPSQPQDQSSPIAEPDTAIQAPSVKQLAAQLCDYEEKWTPAEQQQFGAWLNANFPNEASQGIISLGSAWKAGQRATQAAKPLTDEQITKYYDKVVEDFATTGQKGMHRRFARLIESHLKGE